MGGMNPTPNQHRRITGLAMAIARAKAEAQARRNEAAVLNGQISELHLQLEEAKRRHESNSSGLNSALERDKALRQLAVDESACEIANIDARLRGLFELQHAQNRAASQHDAFADQEPLLRELCRRVGINVDQLLHPRGRVEVHA
jgi:hypothetical protein